jgi:hypothetical protein
MSVSPEEFFMYLIIALIVMIPVSTRIYRYVTAKRVADLLEDCEGQLSPHHHARKE